MISVSTDVLSATGLTHGCTITNTFLFFPFSSHSLPVVSTVHGAKPVFLAGD